MDFFTATATAKHAVSLPRGGPYQPHRVEYCLKTNTCGKTQLRCAFNTQLETFRTNARGALNSMSDNFCSIRIAFSAGVGANIVRAGTGDEDYIGHDLALQFFKLSGDDFREGICREFPGLDLCGDLLRSTTRAILNLLGP